MSLGDGMVDMLALGASAVKVSGFESLPRHQEPNQNNHNPAELDFIVLLGYPSLIYERKLEFTLEALQKFYRCKN